MDESVQSKMANRAGSGCCSRINVLSDYSLNVLCSSQQVPTQQLSYESGADEALIVQVSIQESVSSLNNIGERTSSHSFTVYNALTFVIYQAIYCIQASDFTLNKTNHRGACIHG